MSMQNVAQANNSVQRTVNKIFNPDHDLSTFELQIEQGLAKGKVPTSILSNQEDVDWSKFLSRWQSSTNNGFKGVFLDFRTLSRSVDLKNFLPPVHKSTFPVPPLPQNATSPTHPPQ